MNVAKTQYCCDRKPGGKKISLGVKFSPYCGFKKRAHLQQEQEVECSPPLRLTSS